MKSTVTIQCLPRSQFWVDRFWLVAMTSVLLASCSGVGEVQTESFATIDAQFVGIVEVDDEIWLAVNRWGIDNGAELRRLDNNGSISVAIEVTEHSLHRDAGALDGLIWVREDRPRASADEGVPLRLDPLEEALLGIDPSTGELVHSYPIPWMDYGGRFVFVGGKYWQPTRGESFNVDLATGESQFLPMWGPARITTDIYVEDDFVWLTRGTQVSKVSLETGEPVRTYNVADEPGFIDGQFKRYDGKFWIVADEFDDAENAYEYDPETGEYGNPVSRDLFPTLTFESGDSRWELFSAGWIDAPTYPQPEDTWRRVDIETGEVIGEYDFGDYRPEIATDDYLWLTRHTETGFELARLPLD